MRSEAIPARSKLEDLIRLAVPAVRAAEAYRSRLFTTVDRSHARTAARTLQGPQTLCHLPPEALREEANTRA